MTLTIIGRNKQREGYVKRREMYFDAFDSIAHAARFIKFAVAKSVNGGFSDRDGNKPADEQSIYYTQI